MNTNHTGEETIEAAVVTTVVTISLSLVQVIDGMACRNQVKANHVEVDCRGKMGWNSLVTLVVHPVFSEGDSVVEMGK
jgi:hypothetical protein